jgi:three-Cys-motif partner protein
MAAKDLHFDEIGYWSEVKLEIVRKYAAAYSTILSKQPLIRGHLYIDAFAGAGSRQSGDRHECQAAVFRTSFHRSRWKPRHGTAADG